MKKTLLLFGLLAFLTFKNQAQTTVTDYDGNVYNTVTIGTEVWMKENLKVTHYNNGDIIPNILYDNLWINTTTGARCYNNYDSIYIDSVYGALYPLTLIGEAPTKGNRKFDFDLVNEKLVFKPKKGIKILCQLPKLHKNLRKEFKLLQNAIESKELAVTMRLSNKEIWLTYDETKLVKPVVNKVNRFLAIDLNPNSYGFSIVENDNVLNTEIIDFKELTKKTGKSSDSKESLYQTNKRIHETFEVNKYLVEQAKHWKCEAIVLEDLGTSKMKSFRPVNRLVKNQWSPNRIQSNLKGKYKVVEVGAWYSSTMGNICYGHQYPDAIASSIELARRAREMKTGKWTYPEIPNCVLSNQWKEETNQDSLGNDWKSFHNWLKTSKLKYRSSVDSFESTVFRLNSIRSTVNLISFGRSCNV